VRWAPRPRRVTLFASCYGRRSALLRQAACERMRAQVRVTRFPAGGGVAVARGPTMQAKSASVPFLMEPAKAAELSKLPGEQLSSARLCILPRAGALTTGLCKAHLAVTWTCLWMQAMWALIPLAFPRSATSSSSARPRSSTAALPCLPLPAPSPRTSTTSRYTHISSREELQSHLP
jgi:hypothetical protein